MPRIEFAGLRYDPSDGTLRRGDGVPLTLRPQVASLLEALLERPATVVDRETLCGAVWGEDRIVDFEAGLAALVKELRQAFRSLEAGSELLETVPRRGYRLHAEPRPIEAGDPDRSTSSEERPKGPRGRGGARRGWIAALALLLLVVAVVVGVRRSDEARQERTPSLAVVPFEALGEPGAVDRNLDLVLADTLLSALWQAELEGVVLLGRTSMGADLTGRARAEFVARELEASLILEGSLIPAPADGGADWRVEARLLRLPRGEVAWTSTVSGPAGEEIPVAELARALAEDLARHWPALLNDASGR